MHRPYVLLLSCAAALAVADSSGATTLGQLALQKVLQDSREVFGVESNDSSRPYANWMSTVPDATPLAHLNIPGTHDAATWNYSQATQDALAYATRCDGGAGPAPAQVYRTQRHGAAAALDAGVRFFDLRFAFDPLDRDLVFWHGQALLSARATVDDVLFAFYAWLDAHPREVVLLSFQYEGGTKDGAGFDGAVKGRLRRVLESEAAMRYVRRDSGRLGTLGESRGKIVLVRRFDMGGVEDEALPGLHLGPGQWPDNDPEGFELVYNRTSNEAAYVEDYYEPSDLGANSTVAENIQAKMGAVKAHLEKAAAAAATGGGADSLFITFASGENDVNVPHVFPQTMALGNGTEVTPDGGVNHQLVKLLGEMRGSRLGVVVLDFFDEPAELVGLVLGL
ncbi:PLC-like phosphodiesterase [Daldinia grandis]|nr:PLC-like phosphodiesterase [Daldinia grandis]